MKRSTQSISIGCALMLVAGIAGAIGETLSSTHEHGIVALQPEPALSGDRLVIRVAAKNTGTAAAELDVRNITAHTPAGPVQIVPLQTLIAEVNGKAPAGPAPDIVATHDQNSFSQNGNVQVHDRMGNATQTTTGAALTSSTVVDSGKSVKPVKAPSKAEKAAMQQQVDALQAAILQSAKVAPGDIGAGNIVVDGMRFAGGTDRTLAIEVQFNGDVHEFVVTVPPQL